MVFPSSDLSQENILRDVHDPDSQSLRTTAVAVIDTVLVDVHYESDSVAIGDPNTNTTLLVNADGSINSNVELDAADGDNVAISDGTDVLAINTDGSININLRDEAGFAFSNANPLPVSGPLTNAELRAEPVDIHVGVMSTNNVVNNAPLGAGASYVGTADDVSEYRSVDISCVVDQNGTLYTEFSIDGINWGFSVAYPIVVSSPGTFEGFPFTTNSLAKYFRVRYINGATPQGTFRLSAILKTNSASGEINKVNHEITDKTTAQVTKGVIYGKTTGGGGGYVAVKVNPSGALSADVTGSEVTVTGVSTEAKQDDQILILQDIDNNTDLIETKLDATNLSLDNIESSSASIDTKIDVNLSTRASETTLQTTNTKLDETNTRLTNVETLLQDIEAGIGNFEDTIASGVLTNTGDTVQVATNGSGTVSISITGTWTGQVTFEGSYDGGATWSNADYFPRTTGGQFTSTFNASTNGWIACSGYTHVRVRRNLASSGVANVILNASNGTSLVMAYNKNGNNFATAAIQSGVWTVQPGNTPNTTPWLVRRPPTSSSGTLTELSSTVEFDNVDGFESLGIQITGTWVGTVTPSISVDGTNFVNCSMFQNSNSSYFSSTTSNGIFNYHIGSVRKFKLTFTAYTSGTATVNYFASQARSNNNVAQIIQNTSAAGVNNQTRVAAIETEHQKVHEGKLFHIAQVFSLGSGASRRYLFTPGTNTAHFIYELTTTGVLDFHLYEDPTVTVSTSVTPYNKNRSSSNTAQATLQLITAVTSSGTLIDEIQVGGTGGSSATVKINRSNEWDMPNGKTYMIEFTSGSAGNTISAWIDWYEG